MKKKIFLILTALTLTNLVVAQTIFQKTLGGTNDDLGNVVLQTSDGGYIIAGETKSYGVGNRDAYLVKLDSLGNTLWSKTFGGNAEDYALALEKTTDGGYLFGAHTGSFGQGGHDYYLVKTDSNGDTLWTRLYGGAAADGIYSLQKTVNQGYIMGGHTSSFGAGVHDYYLIKIDANGDTLWTKTYGGGSADNFRSIKFLEFLGSPSYVMAGETAGFGAGATDILIIRIDGQGDTLWSKTYGGILNDYAYSIIDAQDPNLSLIIAGHTNSFGAGGMDVYLIKTDLSGNIQWSKTYGGTGNEYCYSIKRTSDNGYIIVGSTTSFGAGSKDVYLIKTDANGDTLWTKAFGGPMDEVGWSVQQTIDGGYIITGNTSSFGAGLKDIYVIKTDANGNSGCNEFSTSTSTNNASTIETTPNLIINSGTVMSSSATIVNYVTPINLAVCDTINGINQLAAVENQILVFPNPFSKSAVVEFDYKSGNYTFLLYSSTGQLLWEINNINTGQILVEKNNLTEGLYFFQLHNNYEIVGSGKLIIE